MRVGWIFQGTALGELCNCERFVVAPKRRPQNVVLRRAGLHEQPTLARLGRLVQKPETFLDGARSAEKERVSIGDCYQIPLPLEYASSRAYDDRRFFADVPGRQKPDLDVESVRQLRSRPLDGEAGTAKTVRTAGRAPAGYALSVSAATAEEKAFLQTGHAVERSVKSEKQITVRTHPHETTAVTGDARGVAEPVNHHADSLSKADRAATSVEKGRAQDGSGTPHVHHGDRRPPGRLPGRQPQYSALRRVQPQGRKRREENNGGALDSTPRDREVPDMDRDALVARGASMRLVRLVHHADRPQPRHRHKRRRACPYQNVYLSPARRFVDRTAIPAQPAVVRCDRDPCGQQPLECPHQTFDIPDLRREHQGLLSTPHCSPHEGRSRHGTLCARHSPHPRSPTSRERLFHPSLVRRQARP